MATPESDSAVSVSPALIAWIRTVGSLCILIIPLLLSTPPFRPVCRFVSPYISDFVTLDSLVSFERPTKAQQGVARQYHIRIWRQIVFVGLAVIELAFWMAVVGSEILHTSDLGGNVNSIVLPAGMVLVWLYLVLMPTLHPPSTPPWPAALVYFLLWVTSVVTLCLAWYDRASTGRMPPWADTRRIVVESANMFAATCLSFVVAGLRLASPETLSRLPSIGNDDLVTPTSWVTQNWMNPFVHLGNTQELNPEDVPVLSLRLQSAILFERFRHVSAKSLVTKLLLTNKFDLAMDFVLTLTSIVFNYAAPFFLKRILDGLSIRSPEAISRAYVYALLALLASISKAASDLNRLYYSRRASIRIKAELTAAIYDKALRRKDASGVLAEKEEATQQNKKEGTAEAKDKSKTSNADSGKVVNLMAGDATRVGNIVAVLDYSYGSPMEIIIASIFLYNILGWSAFAGVVIMIFAVPANSFLSKRSVKITQELLKARDKRISVMNELLGAIQFIKFFAWTEQWKGRAAAARSKETTQMARSIINSLFISLVYIVLAKRELTVS
ncbi:MAG: hypothetical protein TREMPRED_006043, partial [Tremellales sp. Tagirdzhanova-0007]